MGVCVKICDECVVYVMYQRCMCVCGSVGVCIGVSNNQCSNVCKFSIVRVRVIMCARFASSMTLCLKHDS